MNGVRFVEGDGWEGKCDNCLEWWPIDGDYWVPERGVRKCYACIREANNSSRRLYLRRHPEQRAYSEKRHAERQRRRYAYDPAFREHKRAVNKAYYAAHRDELNARQRARYAEKMREKRAA